MIVYAEDGLTLHQGDALDVLGEMEPESVDCVMTSPPYWSLRKYSGEAPAWAPEGYGLEPTPELYVEHTIMVLRAIRRVLKPSGVVWLNIGDSYAGSGRGIGDTKTTNKGNTHSRDLHDARVDAGAIGRAWIAPPPGLKPKDLVLIPFRVALAAQADGWWVRSDVIWAKPNPMPESVTDRPTKSHEYVLLLAKSERYYFDADAVRERADWSTAARQERASEDHKSMPTTERNGIRPKQDGHGRRHEGFNARWDASEDHKRKQTTRAEELFAAAGLTDAHRDAIRAVGITDVGKARVTQNGTGKNADAVQALADEAKVALGGYYREFLIPLGRNIRSVWTIPTQPSPLPHFASFPEALAERCIKAACPPDGMMLDPFAGTGTALKVARDLGRRAVGIEISAEYCELARKRLSLGVRGTLAVQRGQLELTGGSGPS